MLIALKCAKLKVNSTRNHRSYFVQSIVSFIMDKYLHFEVHKPWQAVLKMEKLRSADVSVSVVVLLAADAAGRGCPK